MKSGFSSIFRKLLLALSARAPIIRNPWNFCERFLRASSQNQSIFRRFEGIKVIELSYLIYGQNLSNYNDFVLGGLGVEL